MAYNFIYDGLLNHRIYRELLVTDDRGVLLSPVRLHLYVNLKGMSLTNQTVTCDYRLYYSGDARNIQTVRDLRVSLNGTNIYTASEPITVTSGQQVLIKEGEINLRNYHVESPLEITASGSGTVASTGLALNFQASDSVYYPSGSSANGYSRNFTFPAIPEEPFFTVADFNKVLDVPAAYAWEINKIRKFRLIVPYVPTGAKKIVLYFPVRECIDGSVTESVWEYIINNPKEGYYDGEVAFSVDDIKAVNAAIIDYNERNNANAFILPTSSVVAFVGDDGVYDVKSYAGINLYPATTSPTISGSVKDVRQSTIALTGDENILVRYASYAKATIDEVYANGGSTIKETYIMHGTESVKDVTSYTFETVSDGTFKFRATDAKNASSTVTVTMPIVNYVIPSSVIKGSIISGNGEMPLKVYGAYFDNTFGAKDNEIKLYYRYKEQHAEEYGEWIELTEINLDSGNNAYEAQAIVTGLNYEKTYTFQARVVDVLYTVYSSEYVAVSLPIFDWSADDFNFNVPVNINGTLTVNGEQIGKQEEAATNNILWDGVDVMANGTTISLAQKISEQKNGIVLVFSLGGFQGGENSAFNYAFVPKIMVSLGSGSNHTFFLTNGASLTQIGAKTLTISDTSISGANGNDGSGAVSTSGVTRANQYFTLRYVIGV